MVVVKWNRKEFFIQTVKSTILPMSLIFFISLINSTINLYLPKYFGKFIGNFDQNNLMSNYNVEQAKILFIIISIMTVTQVTYGLSSNLFIYMFEKKWIIKLISKILYIPYDTFINSQSGYLNKRVLDDIKSIPAIFTSHIFSLFFNLLVIIASIISMLKLLPKLTIFLVLLFVIGGLIGVLSYKYARKWLDELVELWTMFSGFFNQTISNYIMLKGMKAENNVEQILKKKLNNILGKNLAIQSGLYMLLLCFIFLFLSIFSYGIYNIFYKSQEMKSEILITFIGFLWLTTQKILNSLSVFSNMQVNIVYLNRIIGILNISEERLITSHRTESPVNSIEIINFTKKIDNGKTIFNNINMKVLKGDIIAICGESGTGKTSFVRSLFGLTDKIEGEIIINGNQQVNNLKDSTNAIYIPQELFVFTGSIKDNLEIFNKYYESKSLQIYLKKLKLDTRIDYENLSEIRFEETGKNISGGEKQRFIILSMLLRNPDIIILDEPTSQVDIITENIIKNIILEESRRGKIIFLVGHRDNLINISNKKLNLETGEFTNTNMCNEIC